MVKIKIDLEQREKLKRLHTATHIVNFSLREILGNHVWQNGSNLKTEIGSLDVTHYENLTIDEIQKVEKLANKVIFENRKVTIEELDRSEAEKKYGFILYQGGAIPQKTLRVVKVFENDIEACGGLHMESAGGIGMVKIVDTQKIQDGVVRVKFVVNEYALDFVASQQKILKEVEQVFSVDETSVVKTSEKFFNEWKKLGKQVDKLKDELKMVYLESIKNSKENEFKLNGDFDMGFLMDIFNKAIIDKTSFKLVSDKFIVATPDAEVKNFKKEIDKKKFKIYVV